MGTEGTTITTMLIQANKNRVIHLPPFVHQVTFKGKQRNKIVTTSITLVLLAQFTHQMTLSEIAKGGRCTTRFFT